MITEVIIFDCMVIIVFHLQHYLKIKSDERKELVSAHEIIFQKTILGLLH